MIMTLKLYFY